MKRFRLLAYSAGIVVAMAWLALFAGAAMARDLGQWADKPAPERAWYKQAVLTKAAQKRLGFVGCCAYADLVKSKFRLDTSSGVPHWFYLKDGAFVQVPDDIVHWTEQAPDNQPTLFALSEPFGPWPVGTLTCFYPPGGGF